MAKPAHLLAMAVGPLIFRSHTTAPNKACIGTPRARSPVLHTPDSSQRDQLLAAGSGANCWRHHYRASMSFPQGASRPGFHARQPLFGRPAPQEGGGGADHVQINLEAGPAYDLDSEIDQLRSSVGKLKEVSTAIQEENRLTRQVMDGLEDTMEKARLSLKKTIKRIDRAYRDSKSNHMLYLFLFALAAFFCLYAWNRVYKFLKWIF